MKTQINFKSCLTRLRGQMLNLGYHSVVTLPSCCRLHRTLTIILLLLCIGVGNVWGDDSYTITFSNNANGATAISNTVNASTTIADDGSRSYVTTQPYTVNSGSCYYGGDGKNNIRLASSGNDAELEIALSSDGQVAATTIVVNCMKMSGKKNESATLSVNGASAQNAPASADNLTFTINDDITAITLTSVKAVFIYSITVNYSAGCTGSKLGTPVVTATPSSGKVVLSWPTVANASGYQLKWNGGEWASATSGVTKTGLTNGTAYTYQVKAIGNGSTYCDGDASEEANAIPGTYYTVTFMNNGETYATKSILSGTNLILPDNPSTCMVGKEFVGWSSTNIGSTPTDTKPTFVSTQTTISSAQTYYAVFASKTANKYVLGSKTDLIDNRKVLIVNPTNTSAMSGTNSSGKLTGTSVTISSSTITNSSTSIIWTVKPQTDGKYKFIYDGNELYATANNSLWCDGDDFTDSWTITDNNSHFILTSSYCSKNLEYYNGNFTVYNTSTTAAYQMDFYIPEYKNYITTCCTPLGTINGSIIFINVLWV